MAENTSDVEPRPRQSLFAWAGGISQPRQSVFGWITLAARIVLGAAIAVAGFLKIGNLIVSLSQGVVPQSVQAVKGYRLPLPEWIIWTVGVAMPVVEILLGLVIIVGLLTRWTGALGGLMMLAYMIVIASAWARGLKIDCGCYTPGGDLGQGVKPMYWLDELRDFGLLILGAWLFLFPKSPLSVDGWIAGPTTATEE